MTEKLTNNLENGIDFVLFYLNFSLSLCFVHSGLLTRQLVVLGLLIGPIVILKSVVYKPAKVKKGYCYIKTI